MTCKPWCTCKGFTLEGRHACSTRHEGFPIPNGDVVVAVVDYEAANGRRPMVCLFEADPEDEPTLALDASDARVLASLLLKHADKVDSLTEHNHQGGPEYYFHDCPKCRHEARVAALARQNLKGTNA